MTESDLHKLVRKEVLPAVGSRLKEEGLISSHGAIRFSLNLGGVKEPYRIMPDYTLTLPSSEKVPLEIVNSLGNKTVWGNVMVPYVLIKYRSDVRHFIFMLIGYAARDELRFVRQMNIAMEMLRGASDVKERLVIMPFKELDIEKMHEDLKKTLIAFQ